MNDTGKRYLVDEYGTVITEVGANEFCQIKTHKGVAVWKEAKFVKYKFTKVNTDVFVYCCTNYSLFPFLVKQITYLDNALMFRNGRPLKVTNMSTICNLGVRSIRKQIHDMIQDEIIKKIKLNGQIVYVMNPWVCMRGSKVNEIVYEEFESSKWRYQVEEED